MRREAKNQRRTPKSPAQERVGSIRRRREGRLVQRRKWQDTAPVHSDFAASLKSHKHGRHNSARHRTGNSVHSHSLRHPPKGHFHVAMLARFVHTFVAVFSNFARIWTQKGQNSGDSAPRRVLTGNNNLAATPLCPIRGAFRARNRCRDRICMIRTDLDARVRPGSHLGQVRSSPPCRSAIFRRHE